jgi:regulator of sigma E protease
MELIDFIYNNIVMFLVVMTVLVFVHEMGHYLMARRFGVKVDTFSIGFGPEIYGWNAKKSGTRWRISALPLGGYVKFFGDANPASIQAANQTMSAGERAVSFHHKPVWQRFAVVAAGPLANLLFAVVALACMYMFVGQSFTPPIIGVVDPQGPAAAVGLQPGDRVLNADGRTVQSFEDVSQSVQLHPAIPLSITVDRAGKRIEVQITPAAKEFKNRFGDVQVLGDMGADSVDAMARIGKVEADSAGATAGLKPGDLITAIDGKPIATFDELRAMVEPSAGRQLSFSVERDGQQLQIAVTPGSVTVNQPDGTKKTVGRVGITQASIAEHRKLDPASALWQSGRQVVYTTKSIFNVLGQIVVGQRTAKDIGGPLRIAKTTGEASQLGWEAVALLVIGLSISLGVFNLLPVPLLDGGHLLYYAIEAVRGRPLTAQLQEYGARIGIALVFGLVIFATWNDLVLLKVADLVGRIGR